MADHWELVTTRDFALPVDQIYAHWTSPETRRRWEVGDTGMSYESFDTREGATEIVHVTHEGANVGKMTQSHLRIIPNELIVTTIVGHFGDAPTFAFLLTMEFEATDTGSRITATTQMSDFTGTNPRDQHVGGWDWILGRFEADLAEHGPITGSQSAGGGAE